MKITKEQFFEWKENPITKEVFKEINLVKQDLLLSISRGDTLDPCADKTHGLTNRMVGCISGLDQLLNITFDDEPEDTNEGIESY